MYSYSTVYSYSTRTYSYSTQSCARHATSTSLAYIISVLTLTWHASFAFVHFRFAPLFSLHPDLEVWVRLLLRYYNVHFRCLYNSLTRSFITCFVTSVSSFRFLSSSLSTPRPLGLGPDYYDTTTTTTTKI